jgi:hypothetical protein
VSAMVAAWHFAAHRAVHRRLVDAAHARALHASERCGDVARCACADSVHFERHKTGTAMKNDHSFPTKCGRVSAVS